MSNSANSNKGALRNPDRYVAAALRRRTDRFDDCFPRGISLGDIDSFTEINSHFLFLEWKLDHQELPTGQRIALYRLAKQPKTSVWILWTSEDGFITHAQRLGLSARSPVNEETVKQRLREWVASAETGGR